MAASHTFSFLLSRSALGLGSFPEQLSRIAVLQGFTQQSKLLQSFGLCEKQGFQHIHTSAKRQLKIESAIQFSRFQYHTDLSSTFLRSAPHVYLCLHSVRNFLCGISEQINCLWSEKPVTLVIHQVSNAIFNEAAEEAGNSKSLDFGT